MKKTILLLSLSFLLANCSSEDNSTAIESTFAIQLTASTTNVVIDQPLTVTVTGNEEMNEIWASTDNFATGGYAIQSFGTSFTLHFNFEKLGVQTISVRAKNQNNVISEKQIVINVDRGNALKINGIEVISFYGINTVYDPEFPASNPESLADVKVGISKLLKGIPFNNNYYWGFWYQSAVRMNQQNLIWDCSDANLYLNPNTSLKFGLAEMDGEIAGADLLNGPPDYRSINFSNYVATKPTTITYSFPEINLEFKIFVEWSN